MMMHLELILTILGAAAVVGIVGEAARIRSKQLDNQAVCREEFFATAERLIADPERPDHIILDLGNLARVLTSRTALWSFVARALRGRLRNPNPANLRKHYYSVPHYLRTDFVMALVSAIYALTFNNMVLGPLIRRLMLYSVPRRSNGDIDDAGPVGPMVDEFSHNGARAA
jgi:hypothetical protein